MQSFLKTVSILLAASSFSVTAQAIEFENEALKVKEVTLGYHSLYFTKTAEYFATKWYPNSPSCLGYRERVSGHFTSLLDSKTQLEGLTVSDGKLYVCDQIRGVHILDIASKQVIGNLPSEGSAIDVAVEKGFAFVADWRQVTRVNVLREEIEHTFNQIYAKGVALWKESLIAVGAQGRIAILKQQDLQRKALLELPPSFHHHSVVTLKNRAFVIGLEYKSWTDIRTYLLTLDLINKKVVRAQYIERPVGFLSIDERNLYVAANSYYYYFPIPVQ
jgi:hypothetical protein